MKKNKQDYFPYLWQQNKMGPAKASVFICIFSDYSLVVFVILKSDALPVKSVLRDFLTVRETISWLFSMKNPETSADLQSKVDRGSP